jgi:hypothetical protein
MKWGIVKPYISTFVVFCTIYLVQTNGWFGDGYTKLASLERRFYIQGCNLVELPTPLCRFDGLHEPNTQNFRFKAFL